MRIPNLSLLSSGIEDVGDGAGGSRRRLLSGMAVLGAVLVLQMWPTISVAQVTPLGPPVVIAGGINSLTTTKPAVAVDDAGRWVVVWDDYFAGPRVDGRWLTPGGIPLTPVIQLGGGGGASLQYSDVAVTEFGRAVVVWSQSEVGTTDRDIVSRAYLADGTSAPEVIVNETIGGIHSEPAVASRGDGSYSVVWGHDPSPTIPQELLMRTHGADGVPVTSDVRMDQSLVGSIAWGGCAMIDLAPGGFGIVGWCSSGADGYGAGVLLRRVDAKGNPVGDEFQPYLDGSYTSELTGFAAIADSGRFAVGWDRQYLYPEIQFFDDSAAPVGEGIIINDLEYRIAPAGSMAPDGTTVVVNARETDGALFGNVFDELGNQIGDEFQVVDPVVSTGSVPVVAVGDHGTFLVVWRQNSPSDAIMVRRFALSPLFVDGFESGDTGAWSGAMSMSP